MQLRPVGRREPHVLVVEAEAVRVEGDVVGHSGDAGDVYLEGLFGGGAGKRRRGRGEVRERERKQGRSSEGSRTASFAPPVSLSLSLY